MISETFTQIVLPILIIVFLVVFFGYIANL